MEFARRTVAGVGRSLITIGVLLLLFVGYQLWGTGLHYAGAQEKQEKEFAKVLGANLPTVQNIADLPLGPRSGTAPGSLALNAPTTTATSTTLPRITFEPAGGLVVDTEPAVPASTTQPTRTTSPRTTTTLAPTTLAPTTLAPTTLAPTTFAPTTLAVAPTVPASVATTKPIPKVPATTRPFVSAQDAARIAGRGVRRHPKTGQVIAQILIPKLGLNDTVVEGTEVQDLKNGPGHYRGTPMPGNPGNAAIAGHRTTYGAPFFNLDALKPGDPIYVVTEQGNFRYRVREQDGGVGHIIVNPKDNSVLADAPDENRLTLTTCNPRYSARERLIVIADLDGEAAEAEIFLPEPDPAPVGASLAAEPESDPSTVATTAAPAPTTTTTTTTTTSTTTVPTPVDTAATLPATASTTTTSSTTTTTTSTTVATTTAATTVPAAAANTAPPTSSPPNRLANDANRGATYGFWWFHGPGGIWRTTLLWAILCGLVWCGTWLFARGRRLGRQAMIYAPTFLVLFLPALYFCYESLARLLPENV